MMTNTENHPPALHFCTQEDILFVNPQKNPAAMRRRETLHISIVNVSNQTLTLSGADGFAIRLSVTVGDGSGSLFAPRDTAGWGTIESDHFFSSTGWTCPPINKSSLRCTLKLAAGRLLTLAPGASLSFVWKQIVTTACEGYAGIQAAFFGLAFGTYSQTGYIFKKLAIPRIVRFFSSPGCGAPRQTVTLSWMVENAEKGLLLPEGRDILGTAPQQSGSRTVTLPGETGSYSLNITGGGIGVFQNIHVPVTPPLISALSLDEQNHICWETHFATHTELTQYGPDQTVISSSDSCGRLPLEPFATHICLRCSGFCIVERHLIVPPIPNILLIGAHFQIYAHHRSVTLRWKTADLDKFAAYVGDGDAYTLSEEPNGVWEQVYPSTQPLTFLFHCKTADGTTHQMQLRDKGEML